MSELKAFDIVVAEEGYGEGIVKYRRAVYDKSEADKVIADLEESHKMEVEQLLILNREQANAASRLRDSMEQAIRHQKFKRCLAMKKWCDTKADWYYGIGRSLRDRVEFYIKWHKRWLKIADEFKEAK